MPADVAAMASAIAALFHPYVEVAAHDVSSDRLVAIWNAFTSRRPGEVSLLDPELLADAPEGHVYGPYDQVDSRGRCLSSVGIRLDGGRLVLCLNVDRSAIDSVMTFLSTFAAPREEKPRALFQRDWRADLNSLIDNWCREHGASRAMLTREDRRALVAVIDERGAFDTRNAAAHISAELGVSRATVYAMRKS